MNVIWFGLVVYAVIEAIAAAGRVRQKRRASALQAAPTSQIEQPQIEQPQIEQHQPEFRPDSIPTPVEPTASSTESSTLDLRDLSPTGLPSTDLDLPLAVSVSVSDLAQAQLEPAEFDLNLVPPELALPIEPATKPTSDSAPEHSSLLAEIAELGSHTDAVAHFQRYLDHPDDVVRAATVFELGELATKRPGAEAREILELLMPLGQDPDPQVRAQVVVALTKIQPAIS